MALTAQQKEQYRTRVATALKENDAATAVLTRGYRAIRLSDPAQGYSDRNTLLLLFQWDDRRKDGTASAPLTQVAGFYEWQQHGRCVKKGEPGLFILAGGAGREEEQPDGTSKTVGRFFGGTYVWDLSQTREMTAEEIEAQRNRENNRVQEGVCGNDRGTILVQGRQEWAAV